MQEVAYIVIRRQRMKGRPSGRLLSAVVVGDDDNEYEIKFSLGIEFEQGATDLGEVKLRLTGANVVFEDED